MNQYLPNGQKRIEEVRMVDIVKQFPGVLANDQVNFDVKAGDIHALLGENGAGKSTLMKQLYGLYPQNSGKIFIDNVEHKFTSPKEAIAAGIGMIHQHFMLVSDLTVVENVALGLQSSRGIVLDLDKVRKRIGDLMDQYGLRVDPDSYIWQMAVGEQQRVEIIKALYRGASVLILDEPTAVLTPQEVDEVFRTFDQMAADGHALIFISHKLHEVLAISNRVTVLRDGAVVGDRLTEGATKVELAQMMVGRPVILQYDCTEPQQGQVMLKVDDLFVKGDRGSDSVRGVSLELRSGEIMALAGVSGNGQRELAEALAGLRPVRKGKIFLDEKDITTASPGERINAGQSYIPEARLKEGVIKDFSVADNYILEDHNKEPYSRYTFLNFGVIDERATAAVKLFNVKTPSIRTPIKNLSGGNIQKLILARELSRKPKVLIASQPTRGVDIGASEYIHKRLLEYREGVESNTETDTALDSKENRQEIQQEFLDQRCEGTATLLISEDLDEILALADRVAVMYEGEIMGIVHRGEATAEDLGLMMAGVRKE
jgi:general nucleoside transport system ATP-binding protein